MAKERNKALLEKSIASAISAIEVYNKPDFKYREETFSILMINAWELLLKSKILKDSANDLRSIYVQERSVNKNGTPSKRFYPKLNRSLNPMTIEIRGAMEKLGLPDILKENLNLLIEIRDNAIHFLNKDPFFQKKVLEVGTANLKSYVRMFNEWFDNDLSQYNFYLMPISFFHSFEMESFSVNKQSTQVKNLLAQVLQKESQYPSDEKMDHNISLKIETKFSKSSTPDALRVQYDPSATLKIRVDVEEQFKNKYPMDYQELVKKMQERYMDFVTNNGFYAHKKRLESDKKYSDERFLDFIKQTGTSKKYYSTEIFKEFDKYYIKK
ncbi:DUF3644 domain-containing protein [Patescibacteria group bacterium]|nr:DUF3644 domain-containing protein [Patescibacteria group bacterium]